MAEVSTSGKIISEQPATSPLVPCYNARFMGFSDFPIRGVKTSGHCDRNGICDPVTMIQGILSCKEANARAGMWAKHHNISHEMPDTLRADAITLRRDYGRLSIPTRTRLNT